MRIMIQEQGKQQVATLLEIVESQSAMILKENDGEIAQAAQTRLELEQFIRNLEVENLTLKREAQEKEALALKIYTAWEEQRKIIDSSQGFNNGVVANDAESHWDETCGGNEEIGEEQGGIREKKKMDEHITGTELMVCKSCDSRRSCFLFLPCRHLASCKSCDGVLIACPICGVSKKSSIEILNF